MVRSAGYSIGEGFNLISLLIRNEREVYGGTPLLLGHGTNGLLYYGDDDSKYLPVYIIRMVTYAHVLIKYIGSMSN